jgi:hypothetical protein
MAQAYKISADPHYRETFECFARGMSWLFKKNAQEHGMLADELGAYVRRFGGHVYERGAELRGFEVLYSQISQVSAKRRLQPEYFTKWLFDSYRGRDNFMRKLQDVTPARQSLGKPRRIGSERKRPVRAAV